MLKSKRTSFHFPREAAAALEAIWARTRLGNAADVIRAALSTYNALLQIVRGGGKILVRDGARREWPYSPYEPFTYPGMKEMRQETRSPPLRKVPRNFFFSGDAVEKLESIKKWSFAETNADAIRIALTAYNELIRVAGTGDEIVIRDRKGHERLYNPHEPLLCDEFQTAADQVTAGVRSWPPSGAGVGDGQVVRDDFGLKMG